MTGATSTRNRDARVGQVAHDLEPAASARRTAAPAGARSRGRGCCTETARRDETLLRHRREDVDIALDRGVLRDERDRLVELRAHFEDRARDLQLALDRLVRVGVHADDELFAAVSGPRKLLAQQLRRIHFREDARFEVDARRKVAVGVGGAGEAIEATMLASAVRIERLRKSDVRRIVVRDDAFACSIVTWVLSGGRSSCSVLVQPSSNASRCVVSKRPSGLMPAPRPLRGSACLPLMVFRGIDRAR